MSLVKFDLKSGTLTEYKRNGKKTVTNLDDVKQPSKSGRKPKGKKK